MHFYRLFKPKAKKRTMDELVLAALDTWGDAKSSWYDGDVLYVNIEEGLNTAHIQYGSKRLTITKNKRNREQCIYVNYVTLHGLHDPFYSPMRLNLDTKTIHVQDKNSKDYHTMSFDDLSDEMLFQFELLNPLLPDMTRPVLLKFLRKLIEVSNE